MSQNKRFHIKYPDFNDLNERRHDLIWKKYEGGLSEEETKELEILQDKTGKMLAEFFLKPQLEYLDKIIEKHKE